MSAEDAIVATFYYRRTDTMSDETNITARFQQIGGAAASSIVIPLRGRQQWRKISIPFIASASYPAGGARFCFQLSAQIQSLQVSGVSLVNHGQKSLFGPGVVDATPLFTFVGFRSRDDLRHAVDRECGRQSVFCLRLAHRRDRRSARRLLC